MMKKYKIVIVIVVLFILAAVPTIAVQKKFFKDARIFARADIVKIERESLDENNPYDVAVRIHLKVIDFNLYKAS